MRSISVNIITKNEGSVIADCLESVIWADEVVVVDSGSEDNTIDIARNYTDKVYTCAWIDYSTQRNRALSFSTCDWVLVLDADERVSEELRSEVMGLLSAQSPRDAYYIPINNYLGNTLMKSRRLNPDRKLRLFRRNNVKYEGMIHEQPVVSGTVGKLQNPIIHLTYQDIEHYLTKVNRYSSLESQTISIPFSPCYRLVMRPFLKFFHEYFIKKGYVDGWKGLTSTMFIVLYDYLVYAKAFERQSDGRIEEGVRHG